jgi:hypothetical protein
MNRDVVVGCLAMVLLTAACGGADSFQSGDVVNPESPDSAFSDTSASSVAFGDREVCQALMEKSGVENNSRCPASPTDPGDLKLPGEALCLRDSYVFTALASCWHSQCLGKQGVTEADVRAGRARSSPARQAHAARLMLDAVGRLCKSAHHQGGGTSCTTSGLVPCS